MGSAKHPRKWGPLLRYRSRWGDGDAVVEFPDGAILRAGSPKLDEALSVLLDRPVRLTVVPPEQGRPEQGQSEPGRPERAVPAYDGGVPEALRPSAVGR